MTERAPTDEALAALVLHPEDPETASTAMAIEGDRVLAARALELSALRHLLRSMRAGVSEAGPTAEELARYATDPRSLAPADRERIRLHASLSSETRSEIEALRRFLHEASRSSTADARGLAAAPAWLAWLGPRLRAGVLATATLVLGVFVGRMLPPDAPLEVGAKSIGGVPTAPDPCEDPGLTDWASMTTSDVTVCGMALEGDPSGLVAEVGTSEIAVGTRLRVTHPGTERTIVVTVSGTSSEALRLSAEALDRLGVTAAGASRGVPLRAQVEPSADGAP